MRLKLMLVFLAAAVLAGLGPGAVQAAVVGRFIQVQGQVEESRGGKTAVPVKVGDGVEPWDIIRTGADSRAQVRLADDSLVTLAPGSSMVVQDFLYDAPRGERRAMLQIFRGLAHFDIKSTPKAAKPDFLVKTHTAVIAVQGARFFVLPGADFTCAFNEAGLLEASNILPSLVKKTVVKGMEYGFIKARMEPTETIKLNPKQVGRLKQWLQRGVPTSVPSGDPQQIFNSGRPWPV
jgi:ferric-dicitrate binding protein FerR (iron transport regulator)